MQVPGEITRGRIVVVTEEDPDDVAEIDELEFLGLRRRPVRVALVGVRRPLIGLPHYLPDDFRGCTADTLQAREAGEVGISVYHQLASAGYEVAVLVNRHTTEGSIFALVTDTPVEYDERSGLEDILRGYHAVVCVLPTFYISERRRFFLAAVSAGVRRYVTIEPGSDYEEHVSPSPEVQDGVRLCSLELLMQVTREKSDMICTLIFTALCLTPGPQDTCLVDIQNRFFRLYDDGEQMLNLTTATKIAQATTAALRLPPEIVNRILRVFSLAMTQQSLLKWL